MRDDPVSSLCSACDFYAGSRRIYDEGKRSWPSHVDSLEHVAPSATSRGDDLELVFRCS